MAEIIQVVQVYGGDGIEPFSFGPLLTIHPFVMTGQLPAFGALADLRFKKRSKQHYTLEIKINELAIPRILATPKTHKFEKVFISDSNNDRLTHTFYDAIVLARKSGDGDWVVLDIHCNGYERNEVVYAYNMDGSERAINMDGSERAPREDF